MGWAYTVAVRTGSQPRAGRAMRLGPHGAAAFTFWPGAGGGGAMVAISVRALSRFLFVAFRRCEPIHPFGTVADRVVQDTNVYKSGASVRPLDGAVPTDVGCARYARMAAWHAIVVQRTADFSYKDFPAVICEEFLPLLRRKDFECDVRLAVVHARTHARTPGL